MPPAAIITGIGLVTPLGGCVDSTWGSLVAGRAIRNHARVSAEPLPEMISVSRDPKGSASSAGPPNALPFGSRLNKTESRIFHLAHRAAVIAGAGQPGPDALVVGTSKGEVDAWIAGAFFPAAGIGNLASQLGDVLQIAGPRLTISAACASGLQALIRGALLIAAGDAQRVLVVAAESSLHPLFLENYRRLGVLAPEGAGCRPFDRDRHGFCLAEAAAAVMLEKDVTTEKTEESGGKFKIATDERPMDTDKNKASEQKSSVSIGSHQWQFCISPCSSVSSVVNNSRQPPAEAIPKIVVESFAFGSDATHLTGNDPSGQPLRNLLARVMAGRRFDLIHAHGTGTVANDAIELSAIESVLTDNAGPAPLVYSHKAALGHSLGASGLVSVVLNVQMHRTGIVPANVNTPHPLPARGVVISSQRESRTIRRSLAVAAGFGGAMAAVSLIAMQK